ncbi:uncharacterized protein LOC17875747 isoform X2 [Capsella rubella]|uniref:uncharacterized protein LOC17875747 isoform X2 n=1 Tax=Capsella rubella TaxID=81985 RepID=UPI000CD57F2E|nr:uncharacterized protein LOC17875747 isoform X2 [Capsella rubella]
MDSQSKLLSLFFEIHSATLDSYSKLDSVSKIISLITQAISLIRSTDFDSQPDSEFISLITQSICLFNSMDLDSQPDPLRKLISLISQKLSLVVNSTDSDSEFMLLIEETFSLEPQPEFISLIRQILSHISLEPESTMEQNLILLITQLIFQHSELVDETLSLEPEPEFISLIYQIFSLVVSKDVEWKKLIVLCPQGEVKLDQGTFHVVGEVLSNNNDKWKCLPLNWKRYWLTKEDATHFLCRGCNGENHGEYVKAPIEIKHSLHPKHSLQLVLLNGDRTRECYCCDKDLEEVFYYCSACDYAMNIACLETPRVLSVDHPKWHEHTLSQFPRMTSLTCNVCALTHSSCPFYMCPPCDFVVHQKCIGLPRVIRIYRHFHRLYFTLSFDQGVRCCGVCRRKIDNDYGGYSCKKDGCSYAAHSKCATQSNVWDGKDLEGEPEEDIKEIEPFVTVRDGIIRHFSHQHHHLKLDENTSRDYDEDKLCQACITPIYFGNFYSCMQCDFLLHEECAKLSRKINHPIHPHLLNLVGRSDHLVRDATKSCSVCPWRCTSGFFYECSERECRFKVHVQCATISEPLVNESHMHPLFLTSKPGEERRCCVCKELGHCSTNETFNCIECDFALCFKCTLLPQKVRYKHDKHVLTLSYGEETSTMTYWCEVCEKTLNPNERFYMCDGYCCVTLHIECMLGVDLYMKPGSFWLYRSNKVGVLPNNYHMSRPICSFCEKRCPHKIVFQCFGLISCSTSCIRVKDSIES